MFFVSSRQTHNAKNMNKTIWLLLTMVGIVYMSSAIEDCQAQKNKKTLRFRHIMGMYDLKAERDFRRSIEMRKPMIQLRIKYTDSVAYYGNEEPLERIFLNLNETVQLDITDGFPKDPQARKKLKDNKDYQIQNDPAVVEWANYIQFINHRKYYDEYPNNWSIKYQKHVKSDTSKYISWEVCYDQQGEFISSNREIH